MEFVYQHQDWANIKVLGRNRLPVRPFYCGYQNEADAEKGDRFAGGNVQLLNGSWKFSYYETPFRVSPDCMKEDYDDHAFVQMPVPGHWQLNGFDFPHYNDAYALFPTLDDPGIQMDNPTGVYRHVFRTDRQEDREYILRFDGVESAYHVFLNGEFLGYSQGSRNSAEFDATDVIRDGENLLTVIVYKFSDGSYLENQDMWWFAGIIRDVSLIQRPKVHMLDWRIISGVMDAEKTLGGTLKVCASFEQHQTSSAHLRVHAKLLDGEACLCETEQELDGTGFEWETVVPDAAHWSAEQPKLYRLILSLESGGTVIEVYGEWVGFREIVQRDGLFFVNGKAIKFKGVNRHDWNENTGRCITRKEMLADLYLMKQNNINAVRTSHYPPHPDFLDLCDRLGLYVVEEADLECNQMAYTKNMNRLSDDTLWEESYVDRVERMVRRDKNHPSVLIWSLGNESGFGSSFVASGRFVHAYDPTRLVHYEEDRDASVADVYSTMYTRHKALEDLGRDYKKSKPHVVCEYAHAMGNGPGGLEEYWEIFDKYPRLQGGFIWEWVDHGLKVTDPDGTSHYTYGGDYGDYPNSGAFCCDGLIQADRTPTPGVAQVKKVMEPVKFEDFHAETGEITVYNKYDFSDLSHLECSYRVYTLEETILEGSAEITKVQPHTRQRIKLYEPEALRQAPATQDLWLMISVTNRQKPEWAEAEHHEIAFHQELIREGVCQIPSEQQWEPLSLTDRNGILTIEGQMFTVRFDRIHGQLCGYDYHGETLLKDGLGMNFWRAPVDNDKNVSVDWEKAMLKRVTNLVDRVCVEREEQDLVIRVSQTYAPYVLNWKILLQTEYRISPDGTVTMHCQGVPTGNQLPESFPRIGMRFLLDRACEQAVWYGRGSQETYRDCRMGNPIGCWEKTVSQFYFPYVVPQETGNHEDTRWAAFFTEQGNGLCIASAQEFCFGALHYMQEDLTEATHTNQLHRIEDIQLCVDYAQHGLGSASWGAECLEKDKLYPQPFDFTWKIFGTKRSNLLEQANLHRNG